MKTQKLVSDIHTHGHTPMGRVKTPDTHKMKEGKKERGREGGEGGGGGRGGRGEEGREGGRGG